LTKWDGNGNPLDSSGRGNNWTIVRPGANPPYVPGIIGMAFQTTGTIMAPEYPTGNYITLGMPADLDFGATTDFSFSWWGQYTADSAHPDIPWLSNKDWNASATGAMSWQSTPSTKSGGTSEVAGTRRAIPMAWEAWQLLWTMAQGITTQWSSCAAFPAAARST
jgi:hypothetical protein